MSKVVLITGATSGMGKLTASYLASNGYVVYAGTRNKDNLESNIENINNIYIDVTKTDSIKNAVNTIIQKEGKIDVLVNNAGYGLLATIEEGTDEEMFNQFDVNVFGLIKTTREVLPYMREAKQGVIINISSFLGKIGLPLLTLYNSSKYAVEGITDSLRYELSEFNIRVHSIMPGFFDTQFARDNLVTNLNTFDEKSPYSKTVSNLAPIIVEQINNGNDPKEVASIILEIIENENFLARVTAGEKAKKFLPMKKELSDEDFERRVKEYYNIG